MSDQLSASGPVSRPSYDQETDSGFAVDAGTKRILLIMGAGGIAILAAVGAYSMTGRTHGGAIPVVQADPKPIRVRPDNAGGMTVAQEARPVDPNHSKLAPAPEEPRPLAQRTQTGRDTVPALVPLQARPRSITVQLSAAKSEAEAQAAWDKLAKRMPDLLGQRRPLFQKTAEANTPPWRLRTGGFADPARAKAFCDQVKAKGVSCTLVES